MKVAKQQSHVHTCLQGHHMGAHIMKVTKTTHHSAMVLLCCLCSTSFNAGVMQNYNKPTCE